MSRRGTGSNFRNSEKGRNSSRRNRAKYVRRFSAKRGSWRSCSRRGRKPWKRRSLRRSWRKSSRRRIGSRGYRTSWRQRRMRRMLSSDSKTHSGVWSMSGKRMLSRRGRRSSAGRPICRLKKIRGSRLPNIRSICLPRRSRNGWTLRRNSNASTSWWKMGWEE